MALTYQTHTGLIIDKSKGPDDLWRVSIYAPNEPERRKSLYEGTDETAAQREYTRWKSHYEEREKVEKPSAV